MLPPPLPPPPRSVHPLPTFVVEKIWEDVGGDQEEVLSIEKFGGCRTEVKQIVEERERLALRNKVK